MISFRTRPDALNRPLRLQTQSCILQSILGWCYHLCEVVQNVFGNKQHCIYLAFNSEHQCSLLGLCLRTLSPGLLVPGKSHIDSLNRKNRAHLRLIGTSVHDEIEGCGQPARVHVHAAFHVIPVLPWESWGL